MKKTKPSSSPISSAETIAHNQDLLFQFLIRIPPKPLLKLKLISKQWLSLISSLQFSHSHSLHHQNQGFLTPTALFLGIGNCYIPPFELPVLPLNPQTKVPILDFIDDPHFKILQSCNGLLLGHCCYKRNEGSRYFICNPTTRKFKMISLPVSQSGSLRAVNLAFDPIKSPYYKVICVRKLPSPSNRFGIYIYSSKSDEWDDSWISFGANEYIRFDYGVFCNGIIHWNSNGRKSLRFDLENKVLKKMPMLAPMFQAPEESEDEDSRYFGESRGHLHLGVTYMPLRLKFNVFEMAADYSHWFLKYSLNLDDAMKAFPDFGLPALDIYYGFRILSVIRSEGEVSKVVILVDCKAICYELKGGILLNLYELKQCPETLNRCPLNYIGVQVYQYFETLSCV
ncbi:F-box protein At5g07610-like [Durio zibethinus]|uniref:F-box protein At5g07610-like n=1 Tax=Durio zibethinus TaxID=66656 RepID=A0A6P5YV20_DURZI|nr:F-box protein At5g07610-like [Durio zibethinus]XP_022744113.1 F-box protein At5g07610-like [Durio zibethinus]